MLAAGHELAAREVAAPVFFSFDDGGSGFVVSPATFAAATRIADPSSVRIVDRAGVAIIVERAEATRGDG